MKPLLDQKIAEFVKKLDAQAGKPLYTLSPADARIVLNTLQKNPQHLPDASIEKRTIPGGSLGDISLSIIRPADGTGVLPAIVYIHGAGWILGNEGTHDRLVRDIATQANVAVIFVEYSLAPEAQYPTQIEQAYAALQHVATHAKELNIDTSRLVIVGDSVGGNMATAVTMLAKQRGGPKIDYQILMYPVTDSNFDTGSYNDFAEGPWLTKKAMQWFWDAYLPDRQKRKEPTASPLQASLDELKGLPPALIITNENDVLRDEAEAYAHKLMQAGVPVEAIRLIGTIHDSLLLNAISDAPQVRFAIATIAAKLKQLFSK